MDDGAQEWYLQLRLLLTETSRQYDASSSYFHPLLFLCKYMEERGDVYKTGCKAERHILQRFSRSFL